MRVLRSSDIAAALRTEIGAFSERSVDLAASVALETAVRMSSGPWSRADLAAADHPYATRHGAPRLDPGQINVQTGAFRSRWRGFKLSRLHARIVNDDPKADMLASGTERMFPRPVKEKTEAETARRLPHAVTLESDSGALPSP